jgi:hypothetical protein
MTEELSKPKRKIALLFTVDGYYENMVTESIREWVEVTQEEYDLLERHRYGYGDIPAFTIIEQPLNQKEFISKTVKGILDKLEEYRRREQKEREDRQKKREEAKAHRKQTSQAKKLEQLLRLQQEVGHLIPSGNETKAARDGHSSDNESNN